MAEDQDAANEIVRLFRHLPFQRLFSYSCLYTNAKTLNNKMEQLRRLLQNGNQMVVGITEINPTHGHPMTAAERRIANYDVFVAIPNNRRGACLYIHENLMARRVDLNGNVRFRESVWVEVDVDEDTKVLIGCIYRRRRSLRENNEILCRLMENTGQWSHVLVMGDFNYPNLLWDGDNPQGRVAHVQFFRSTQNALLIQHVHEPTTYIQNENILDLVFCRDSDHVNNLNVGGTLGNSYHYLIYFEFTSDVDVDG